MITSSTILAQIPSFVFAEIDLTKFHISAYEKFYGVKLDFVGFTCCKVSDETTFHCLVVQFLAVLLYDRCIGEPTKYLKIGVLLVHISNGV